MTLLMILAPLFALVLMTLIIGIVLASRRTPLLLGGKVREQDISLRQPNWPAPALQAGFSFQNQFELPVLFYVLTILAIIAKHADFLFVVLAWIFVLTRIAHAYVHCTNNNLQYRGAFFAIGALVLMIMWLIFIVKIMLGLP
ncbi:MAG: MAPEG family protein [Alphaproteobacteria bacterium]|nr:MAPEG family protein [Alphaproteobacteria bacterium]